MLGGDLAQPFEVAHRRRQHASGAGERFHDHRGDGRCVVDGDDAFKIVRKVAAPGRLATTEALLFEVVGLRQVQRAGQQRPEALAVGADAAHARAAEAGAVVAPLPPDEARARRFAPRRVVRQGDLQRGVHGLGTGVDEEHCVQILRRHRRQPFGDLERRRMAKLKSRGVVEGRGLFRDCGNDLRMAVAGVAAPQPGNGVEHFAAVRRAAARAGSRNEQPRLRLEGAVGRERHPVRVEIQLVVQARRHWAQAGRAARAQIRSAGSSLNSSIT